MTNAPLGSRSVSSSLVNMTPLVYSTQKGSNVVGEELGLAEGVALGAALGVELGMALGEALGVADGDDDGDAEGDELGVALGVADGDADACDSLSKSQSPPVPAQPTMKA